MGIRAKVVVLTALVVATAGMATAPASATTSELSITNVRTGPSPIVSGSNTETTFKVSVTNNASYAVGAIVYGKLDSGVIMTAVSSAGADCMLVNQSTFFCDTGPGAGATRGAAPSPIPGYGSIEVDVSVLAFPTSAPGTYTLCSSTAPMIGAPASGPGCQPVPPDGPSYPAAPEATATVDVVMEADLGVTATDAPQTDPGAQAQPKFQVTNGGPSLPPKVFLRGTLPPGLTFVSGEGGSWSCSAAGQDVTCEYVTDGCWAPRLCGPRAGTGNFHAIPPVTWTVDTAKPGRVSSYRVPVTVSGEGTTNTGGGQTFALIPVTPVQLDVSKTLPSRQFTVGDELTWTITVSNTGTIDDAGKITVTDTLPSAVEFLSASGDGWTCSHSGQKVVCDRSGLAKGATSQVRIKTRLKAGGRVTNSVELSSESHMSNMSITGSAASLPVKRLAQKAKPLPRTLSQPIPAGRTNRGQKVRTEVHCRPYRGSAAGETRLCKVTRRANEVKVQVTGSQKTVVVVLQYAPATPRYKRFFQKKIYVVNP